MSFLIGRFRNRHRGAASRSGCDRRRRSEKGLQFHFLETQSGCLGALLTSSLQQAKSYPPEELEWLATTAFNRAIDFYCLSQDAPCRLWAEKALTLSNLCEDGGALHEVVQQKYQGLSWHT